MGSAGETG
ncbi:hypothetical protein YPPY96_4533, partial [Yersinia pestis PY-96]